MQTKFTYYNTTILVDRNVDGYAIIITKNGNDYPGVVANLWGIKRKIRAILHGDLGYNRMPSNRNLDKHLSVFIGRTREYITVKNEMGTLMYTPDKTYTGIERFTKVPDIFSGTHLEGNV